MTRRDLPSDPLCLLRESQDVAPPEGAEARVGLRLANLAVAGAGATASVTAGESRALESTGRPSGGVLGRRFLRWSVTPLGLGVAIGAGGHALLASTSPPSPRPSLPTSPATTMASAAPLVAEAPSAPRLDASSAPPAAAAEPPRSTLIDERLLLDRARQQLASEEPARALVFLEQHAKRFTRGELTEEREAMRINVLVQLGRTGEAKTRAAAFAARFPSSIMGPSVRSALKAAEAAH
jgi:hypothetical protein